VELVALVLVLTRLQDPKFKVAQASELRDSIEVFQATDYQRFLSRLIPIFLKILGDGQPIFVSTIPEQVKHLSAVARCEGAVVIVETPGVYTGDITSSPA
jgi:hypothetical protein